MSYQLENQFYADKIDFSKWNYPKVKVQTWNSIIGKHGQLGSIAVQADENKELNHLWLQIKDFEVFGGDDQEKIREKAKRVAIRFNKDLKKNWDSVLLKAFKYCLDWELSKDNPQPKDENKIKLLKKNIDLLTKNQ